MTAVFAASLIAGLLLAVQIMMYGVEKPTRTVAPDTPAQIRLGLPALALFLIFFGGLGYALLHATGMGWVVATCITAAVALAAGAVALSCVRRWARVATGSEGELRGQGEDPRYALQGQCARVIRGIGAGVKEEGAIAFDSGSSRRIVRARSLTEAAVEIGADVVIDRIEDDVAYVERWDEVEKRL